MFAISNAELDFNHIFYFKSREEFEDVLKLKKYIEDSVRFYNCQFIISTHSPFFNATTP
jgi:hypothetical protein